MNSHLTHIFASSRACSYHRRNREGVAASLPNTMTFRPFYAFVGCALTLAATVRAENLSLNQKELNVFSEDIIAEMTGYGPIEGNKESFNVLQKDNLFPELLEKIKVLIGDGQKQPAAQAS